MTKRKSCLLGLAVLLPLCVGVWLIRANVPLAQTFTPTAGVKQSVTLTGILSILYVLPDRRSPTPPDFQPIIYWLGVGDGNSFRNITLVLEPGLQFPPQLVGQRVTVTGQVVGSGGELVRIWSIQPATNPTVAVTP